MVIERKHNPWIGVADNSTYSLSPFPVTFFNYMGVSNLWFQLPLKAVLGGTVEIEQKAAVPPEALSTDTKLQVTDKLQ